MSSWSSGAVGWRRCGGLLDARELDMALTWDYPWNRTDDRRVVTRPLMSDPTVLLLPLDHRLARRRTVRLGELADEAWIIRAEGHATRDLVARAARVAGFEARIAIEANDYPEVQAMIAAGLGIALCPQLATHPLRTDVMVKRLEASVPVRRICTAHLAGREPSPAYRAMETTLRDVVADYRRTPG